MAANRTHVKTEIVGSSAQRGGRGPAGLRLVSGRVGRIGGREEHGWRWHVWKLVDITRDVDGRAGRRNPIEPARRGH